MEQQHRVRLVIDGGFLSAELVCPEGCCELECWIKTWFDNLAPDELLHGRVEVVVPMRAEWDGDSMSAHIAGLREEFLPVVLGHGHGDLRGSAPRELGMRERVDIRDTWEAAMEVAREWAARNPGATSAGVRRRYVTEWGEVEA